MILNQSSAPERATCSNKPTSTSTSPRSPKSEFPIKLYAMLELADKDNIPEFAQAVTWLPHGRAFKVLDKDKFMKEVVPVFFNQTKIRSFNRQLHLWGFHRPLRQSNEDLSHCPSGIIMTVISVMTLQTSLKLQFSRLNDKSYSCGQC